MLEKAGISHPYVCEGVETAHIRYVCGGGRTPDIESYLRLS